MKLSSKGMYLVQLMAATVILSYAMLHIHNNLINMIKLNQTSISRIEAFNNAEFLANHLIIVEDSLIADSLNPVGVSVSSYSLSDCANPLSPIRDVLEDGSGDASYCESLFIPNFNDVYEDGMIELYIFESLEANFTYIINGTFPDYLKNYASNYSSEYYSTGLTNYRVDNVVIVVHYFEDTVLIYEEVILYEIL